MATAKKNSAKPKPAKETFETKVEPKPIPVNSANHKSPMVLALIALSVLAAAIGIWVWRGGSKNQTTPAVIAPAPKPAEAAKPTGPPPPTKLLYAYDEFNDHKPAIVRSFNLKTQNKKDVLYYGDAKTHAYDEPPYSLYAMDVSLSPNKNKIAYTSGTGLQTTTLATKKTQTIIKLIPTHNEGCCANYTASPVFALAKSYAKYNDKVVFAGIGSVQWSRDNKYIGFDIGAPPGEGGYVNAINIKTKKYANPAETGRYIDFDVFYINRQPKLDVIKGNTTLRQTGLFGGYLFKPEVADYSAVFDPDNKHVFAVICPHVHRSPSDYDANQEDCYTSANNLLIRINAVSGNFQKIALGHFGEIGIYGDDGQLYIKNLFVSKDQGLDTYKSNYNISVVNPKTGKYTEKDVLAVAKVNKSEVLRIQMTDATHPLATIYYKRGGQYYASVVSIQDMKFINEFALDKHSSFETLGLL